MATSVKETAYFVYLKVCFLLGLASLVMMAGVQLCMYCMLIHQIHGKEFSEILLFIFFLSLLTSDIFLSHLYRSDFQIGSFVYGQKLQ